MLAALVLVLAIAPPQRWATDDARVLTAPQLAQLDARLEALEAGTGHQVVVYVGRTLGQQPIEEWAAKTFGEWKVGKKGLDDGAALFVFVDDRTARLEVGYGLEPVLTDVACARILRDVLGPKMAAGDPAGALNGALDAITAQLGAGPGPPGLPVNVLDPVRWGAIGLAVVAFIALAIWKPQLAWMLLMLISGRGWGGKNRRGGFGGGGGRSGGGGATGHW